jgi:phage portal protein BeeE
MKKQPNENEKKTLYEVVRDAVMASKSTDSASVQRIKKVSFAVLFVCTTIISVAVALLML